MGESKYQDMTERSGAGNSTIRSVQSTWKDSFGKTWTDPEYNVPFGGSVRSNPHPSVTTLVATEGKPNSIELPANQTITIACSADGDVTFEA